MRLVAWGAPILATLVASLIITGCGGTGGALLVSAASSLQPAMKSYGPAFGKVTFSYGGSDQLAAQIRTGARPDVFLAANSTIPNALFGAHLVERPVAFATNALVLAVPAHSARVHSLSDATKQGIAIVTGSPTVPIGSYTITVLDRLGARGKEIRANVRSQEPDDASIVGKLLTGAADAGFVYQTDVTASRGALRAISLPAYSKPVVVYGAAVVVGSAQMSKARRFVSGLLAGRGAADLVAAGFGRAP